MKRFVSPVEFLFLLLLNCFVAGCTEEYRPETPCEKAYWEICTQACDCSENCKYKVGNIIVSSSDFQGCYETRQVGVCDMGVEWDFWDCIQPLRANPPVCQNDDGNYILLPEPACSPVAD